MSEQTSSSASEPLSLPDAPNLEWLRKEAKRHLLELRATTPDATLADSQLSIARRYGFKSWRALKAHIDSLSLDGQLFAAAGKGDTAQLSALLDAHPDKLLVGDKPYEQTLLHVAAREGHLATVNMLLDRGISPNVKEKGDRTYPMHWAAAAGHLDIVRRLADAGGDVVGHGDDHGLEVIGWATCWDGQDDDAHREVVAFLLGRGAKHHIFSAIGLNSESAVRGVVSETPSALSQRMTRNENHQTPLHFAVGHKRPEMVSLLLELGADPLAVDDGGMSVATYAQTPDIDRPVMLAIRDMTRSELDSAARGFRPANLSARDLVAALAVQDWQLGETVLKSNATLASDGALHLMSKRGDMTAVTWLLKHGADVNAVRAHWDTNFTALHAAILGGHEDIVRLLLDAGADINIHDTKHDGDAIGWAQFFGRDGIQQLLVERGAVLHTD